MNEPVLQIENLSSPCLFCDILGKGEILFKNETAFAIADAYPVTPGHTLILPMRHVSDFFDLTDGERSAICEILRIWRSRILKRDREVCGFNIGVNCGEAAGQTIFHCHVHLIPRRHGDVPDPRGGVRGVIPEKMNYPRKG